MNNVKCISGLRQEGKTHKLLEAYTHANKLGKGINAILIICGANCPTDMSNVTDIIKILDNVSDVTYNDYTIVNCSTYDGLIETISNYSRKHDCNFYIDMPELMDSDFSTTVQNIVDKHPNQDVPYSIDVTWTRERNV